MSRPEDIRQKLRQELIESLEKECFDSRAELRNFRREVISSRFEKWLELSGPLSRERREREHAYLLALQRREEERFNAKKLALKVLLAEEEVYLRAKEYTSARGYKDFLLAMYNVSLGDKRDLRNAQKECDTACIKHHEAYLALEKLKYEFMALTWNPEDPKLVQQAHVRFLQKLARDLKERVA